MRQSTEKKRGFLENAMEYISRKLGRNVREKASDKATVLLLKKSGSSGAVDNATVLTTTIYGEAMILVDSRQYNVAIGSGNNKLYLDRATNTTHDTAGTDRVLVSEVINGVRHIYAGFDNYGTSGFALSEAMEMADWGDRIIARGGRSYDGYLSIKSGVSLYGGYNEDGVRDLTNTASVLDRSVFGIVNSSDIEINGFTFRNRTQMPFSITDSSNIIITNSDLQATPENRYLVLLTRSSALITNNLFSNSQYGVMASGSTLTVDHNTFTDISYALYVAKSKLFSSNNNFLTVSKRCIYNYTGQNPTSMGDYFDGKNTAVFTSRTNILNPSQAFIEGRAKDSQLLNSRRTAVTYAVVTNDKTTVLNAKDNRFAGTAADPKRLRAAVSDINKINAMSAEMVLAMFKAIIHDKRPGSSAGFNELDSQKDISRLIRESLAGSDQAAPGDPAQSQAMDAALALAAIMKNPTEDQKAMIDSVGALLSDMEKIESVFGQSSELTRAQSDLVRMLCSMLLAQAVPDLLKEGDVAGVKKIFEELGLRKESVMFDYEEATKPYYESVKEDLVKNMAALKLNNILSKDMLEKELLDASRSEIDRILEKLRRSSSRFAIRNYLLKREGKYRRDYLVSSTNRFEAGMKFIIEDAAKKLQEALSAKKSKI